MGRSAKSQDPHWSRLREWLLAAMNDLSKREQFIVRERRLRDQPRTLESLGKEMKVKIGAESLPSAH